LIVELSRGQQSTKRTRFRTIFIIVYRTGNIYTGWSKK